ncbi:terminase gpA endonuclease subunit [Salinisphaera sp. T31B1]|uniref:terminase gpA endonuclease subunit n=1 Tax=Salinisphaera sp. T31B1 TaxID=727963 RepID=UPI00333F6256
MRVSEAAAQYLHVVDGSGNVRLWSPSMTPYMIEPMDCLASRRYDAVIFVGPSRSGKSMALVDGWQCYCRTCDPGDMMIVHISETKANEYSKIRLDRQLRNSPEMAKQISPRAHDDNVYNKIFRDGSLLAVRWPTKNLFAASEYRFVAFTDLDRLAASIDGEGDAFTMGSKRTQTFLSRGMALGESSPGVIVPNEHLDWQPPHDTPHMFPPLRGIVNLFNEGDRRRLYWQCDGCREWYRPEHENWNLETGRPACPHCDHEPDESDKKRLNKNARWVPEGCALDADGEMHGTPRKTRIASFAMEGPAAGYQTWESLATKLLSAEQTYERTGSQETLQTVVNTDWGRPFFPKRRVAAHSGSAMAARATVERLKVVPPGVRFLTCTIDVQGGKDSRFVVQVHGHGAHRERWVIDRFNIKEDRGPKGEDEPTRIRPATQPEDWDVLTRDVLPRTYALAGERTLRMPIMMIGVDSGGESGGAGSDSSVTRQAYDWYRRLVRDGQSKRVMLLKGATHKQQQRVRLTAPESRGKAGAKGDIPLWIVDKDQLIEETYGQLQREEPGPNYLHTPAQKADKDDHGIGGWWYDELVSMVRNDKGRYERRTSHAANEAMILLAYDLAVLTHLGGDTIDWDNPPDWAKPWDSNPLLKNHALLMAPVRRRRPRRRQSRYLNR